jgi:hypothetical protein
VICWSSEPALNPDTFGGWNNVSSIGAYISAVGLIAFPIRKDEAGDNSWESAQKALE